MCSRSRGNIFDSPTYPRTKKQLQREKSVQETLPNPPRHLYFKEKVQGCVFTIHSKEFDSSFTFVQVFPFILGPK